MRYIQGQIHHVSIKRAPAMRGKGRLAASDSGAIRKRFVSDSVLEERFGIAGMWVSERFERDHFPLV